MKKLDTIQKENKLNTVYVADEKGPGNANHKYDIVINDSSDPGIAYNIVTINFQKGPRKDINSIQGVTNEDLLEIVRHRLQCFQAGEFACEYNQRALENIELALKSLNDRVNDRVNRNVLGKNEK